MSKTEKCGIEDLLALFEDTLTPADVLSSKLMSQISSAITRERLKLHMTQTEFAEHIHVKQSQVSRWEHGNYNFSLEKIAEIAAKLNLDVNISVIDMSVYKSLEVYNNEHIVSPRPFSFVYQDTRTINRNCVYSTNDFHPVFSSIKEDTKYVTIR